ncbi:glycosyltransferase [Proteiniphilum sp. X52]|uniref:glycosyltransferase n=1 Tax=Proteiniphilum sp. X52 TaxID=2382159 RepID=UPI000F09DBA0|nr:glycosyltransferase [Proteiniphilum sp. X52]RNC64755.1 glycosyltransferase [Proteiniphilum sp. X52]
MSNRWILYVGGFELPDKNAAAQRVIGNGNVFKKLGYDTFFLGLSKKEQPKYICDYEGFKYTNLPYPANKKGWYKYLTSIRHLTPFLEKKPTLIIAYNYPSVALSRLRRWSRKHNTPLISDCTEWYGAKGNVLFRAIKGFDTYYRMRVVHPKLDGIITISSFLYGFYKKRMRAIVNIPPLVDSSMLKWQNNDFVKLSDDDKIQVVYAGSPGAGNKDRIDLILDSLSNLKNEGISNFFFTIIGITLDQFEESFAKSIPANIIQNIEFKGRLTHLEALSEIKKAHFDLFLRHDNLTNRAGFPTKFVESISCGTPVLTNDMSDIRKFMQHGKNGFLLDISNEKILTESLKKIFQLPQKDILEMKEYCRKSNLFDYKNYISMFEELLSKINKNEKN